MGFIPTRVHGVLDYVTAATLLSAPRLLGLDDVPVAARTLKMAGGGAAAYGMITDYELGLVRALPAASPGLFGFAGYGPRYWLPHVLVGAQEILAAATTETGRG